MKKTITWVIVFAIFIGVMVLAIVFQNGILQFADFIFIALAFYFLEQKKFLGKSKSQTTESETNQPISEYSKMSPRRFLWAPITLGIIGLISLVGMIFLIYSGIIGKDKEAIEIGIGIIIADIFIFAIIISEIKKYRKSRNKF